MDEILDFLIKTRRERGLTLKELSEKSGVSQGTVNKLFSGAIRSVKVSTARKLADAMDADLGTLTFKREMSSRCDTINYGYVRCAAVTNEIKVGDVDFNVASTVCLIKKLAGQNVSVAVFPELNLTSYTAGDLFFQDVLLKSALNGLKEIAEKSCGLDMLIFVGLPLMHHGRLYNTAAAVCNGEVLAFIPKKNLPDYNEFNEKRWFCEPGDEVGYFDFNGKKVPFGYKIVLKNTLMPELTVACEICEDLWVADSPSISHSLAGATVIANLSASNEVIGKAAYRRDMINVQASKCLCAYIYTSSGKGESTSETVFGGHDYISEGGKPAAESRPFEDGLAVADIDCCLLLTERYRKIKTKRDAEGYSFIDYYAPVKSDGLLRKYSKTPFVPLNEEKKSERCREVFDIQTMGLVARIRHISAKKLVLGLSGGLDSTLAALVCENALKAAGKKPSDLVAITMPCFGTGGRTYNNACLLAKELKCTFLEIDIKESVKRHLLDIGHDAEIHDIAYENAQARERTQVLMDYANMTGGIVVGTGDLSEIALGWSTYNGDQMSMYNVNAGVPKTLMKEMVLGEALKRGGKTGEILKDIADTPISPELKPAENGEAFQSTENVVGPYILNDFFMFHLLRHGFSPLKVYYIACNTFKDEFDRQTVCMWLEKFIKRFFNSQFKRSAAPDGVKTGALCLSAKAGFKMPSDACCEIWLKDLAKIKEELGNS